MAAPRKLFDIRQRTTGAFVAYAVGVLAFLVLALSTAWTQTYTVLYSFKGQAGLDGSSPIALALDNAGNLYGVTIDGAGANYGTLFRVDGQGNETVLHVFGRHVFQAEGVNPNSLVRDAAGNLYGTTQICVVICGGQVFSFTPKTGMTVLHSFSGTPDGNEPLGGVVRDCCGNTYGTTNTGGTSGFGTVYRLDKNNNETVLHSFSGGWDGANPQGPLTSAGGGIFYGTTIGRRLDNHNQLMIGTLFRIDSTGKLAVMHRFGGAPDGEVPIGNLLLDTAGNIYGIAQRGGNTAVTPSGCGIVFKVDPSGVETILHSFTFGADGCAPTGGLVMDSSGNLYGVTEAGGTNNSGTIFKIDTAGNETVLHTFGTGLDGDGVNPIGGLLIDAAGNFYGTTSGGGIGWGTVFSLVP
jgi:uncharacterized repeat protein (TIGR03803 family)